MREIACPVCHGPLQVRDVAPCDECGGDPDEIAHFHAAEHTYAEYEIFPGLSLVLCNFCDVDFGSYDPTYFGLPRNARLGCEKMQWKRSLDAPTLGKDKFCPECQMRLAFLRFVRRARDLHATAGTDRA